MLSGIAGAVRPDGPAPDPGPLLERLAALRPGGGAVTAALGPAAFGATRAAALFAGPDALAALDADAPASAPGGGPPVEGPAAGAAWEGAARRLTLTRDALGARPLFYATLPDGGLAFASSLRALALWPGVSAAPDPAGIDEFLAWGHVRAPRTILRGVRKLPAGHRLVWEPGRERLERSPAPAAAAARDASLRGRLEAAVRRLLPPDGPAFVLATHPLVERLVAEAAPGRARRLALAGPGAPADAIRYDVGPGQIMVTLPQLLDEPLADPELLGAAHLLRAAAEATGVRAPAAHLPVSMAEPRRSLALSGHGAGELLGTDPRHRAALDGLALPAWRRALALRLLGGPLDAGAAGPGFRDRARLRASTPAGDPGAAWRFHATLIDAALRERLVRAPFREGLAADAAEDGPPGSAAPADRLLALDLEQHIPGLLLPGLDALSVWSGVELRSPFLEPDVVGLIAAAPPAQRAAMLEETGAPGRAPVTLPLERWWRGELADLAREVLTGRVARDRGIVEMKTMKELLEEHRTGARRRDRQLHALLVLELWLRAHAEGPREMRRKARSAAAREGP
jgi:asparagine synthase (glutamine-hydrolysing)